MDVIARDFRDELSTIYTCIHLYPANGNHGGSSRMCGSWMIVMILQSGVSGILIQMRRPVGKQSRRVGRLVVSFFFWILGMFGSGAFCRWRLILLWKIEVHQITEPNNHEKVPGGGPWEVQRVLLYVVWKFPGFPAGYQPLCQSFQDSWS